MDRCYNVPEQVLFNLLLYLPILSLLRFKSVCKSWYSTIENPFFITQRQNYNNEKEDMLVMFHRNKYDTYEMIWLSESQYKECFYIDFGQLMWCPIEEAELVSSCNGIVCLHGIHSLDVALWNPALKQLRPLPQPLFYGRSPLTNPKGGHTGFGIDDKTNDFKVLKVFDVYPEEFNADYTKLGSHVEVYSLRENSWRIIYEDGVLPFADLRPLEAISSYGNRKCFWIGIDYDYTELLVSFDFHNEVFETMLFPDGECKYFSGLSTCNDKIVYSRLIDGLSYIDGGSIEIWMLNEFGVKESWNRLYKGRPVRSGIFLEPLCFSKNGEILICQYYGDDHEWMLHSYNLHTQEENFLQFKTRRIIHYSPSLIPIRSVNGEGP